MRKEELKLYGRNNIPSFSSSLLDEIYRSIDDEEEKNCDGKNNKKKKNYKNKSDQEMKKQIKTRAFEEAEMANLRRACLIEKWARRRQELIKNDHDRDNVLFFSSNSNSSESSSCGFSSSDTESMFGFRTRSLTRSCFSSSKPKPIRTSVVNATVSEKTERKQKPATCRFNSVTESHVEKTRLSELKKVKQPISPGGRLAGLLNSLFTKKSKSGEESTCSSASSFTRSCLSKYSHSERERMGNEVKRTVRFSPTTVVVDEDCTPYPHKCLFEQDGSRLMPMSVSMSIPTAWKIGRLQSRKREERSKKVEDVLVMKKNLNAMELKQSYRDFVEEVDGGDEDDDGASCSSSDLFELDHLELIGRRDFSEELPVYETTHVQKNRAITKSLLMQS